MTKNTKMKRKDRQKRAYLNLKEKRDSGKTLRLSEMIEYESLERSLNIGGPFRTALTRSLERDILIEIDYAASTGQKELVIKEVHHAS